MSIPSLGIGKRFRSSKKPWKPFTKLCKAVKNASRHITALLSSSLSSARKKRDSTSLSPYSLKTSLYHCPCNYHKRQHKKLRKREVSATEDEYVDQMSTRGPVESHSPDSLMSLEEEEVDEREKEDTKYLGEVDKRAELFIKTFQEDQRLQRQRSMEEFYDRLASSA